MSKRQTKSSAIQQTEAQVVSDIRDLAGRIGAMFIRHNAGMIITQHGHAVKLAEEGFPDIQLLLGENRMGPGRACSLFIEAKRSRGGVVSPAQSAMHQSLERMGFAVVVASSVQDVIDKLHEMGVVE
jgi:hypothetical protein